MKNEQINKILAEENIKAGISYEVILAQNHNKLRIYVEYFIKKQIRKKI